MKEEQIKEMLNGIINNDEKWECRHSVQVNKSIDFPEYEWSNWQTYKLGEEIHEDWEYRKVEKKTWLEEYLNINCDDKIEAHNSKIDIENTCKQILEEMENKLPNYIDEGLNPFLKRVKQIITDLGIEL